MVSERSTEQVYGRNGGSSGHKLDEQSPFLFCNRVASNKAKTICDANASRCLHSHVHEKSTTRHNHTHKVELRERFVPTATCPTCPRRRDLDDLRLA